MTTGPTQPLTSDDIFEGFDTIAPRLGIDPPKNPSEQAVVASFIRFFFLGVRWREHVLEHQESMSDKFALPGIDFDLSDVERDLRKRKGKGRH